MTLGALLNSIPIWSRLLSRRAGYDIRIPQTSFRLEIFANKSFFAAVILRTRFSCLEMFLRLEQTLSKQQHLRQHQYRKQQQQLLLLIPWKHFLTADALNAILYLTCWVRWRLWRLWRNTCLKLKVERRKIFFYLTRNLFRIKCLSDVEEVKL